MGELTDNIENGAGGIRTESFDSDPASGSTLHEIGGSVFHAQHKHRMLMRLAPVIVLTGAFVVYVALLAPDRFGDYHDDGIYVSTAKALATGQGYRIISLPYEPAQTKYPPLYSFLLALIWRVYPQFPQNLIWMILISVAATLSFLALTFRYLVKHGYSTYWQALIVVALAAVNWRTLTVATGIYSEMVYAALSVAGLYLAETYEKEQKNWVHGLVLGVVLGLIFLTRSSGISVLIAVGAYYVVRRHSMRAVLPVGVGGLFVLGWIAWCYANKTNAGAVNVAYYTDYVGYFRQVVGDLASSNGSSFVVTFLGMLGRNAFMLLLISIPVVCLGIPYEWILYFGFALLFFVSGFYRQISKGIRLLYVYLICYLGLHLLWLPYVSYDRFLIPLLPFLLLILVSEFTSLTSLLRKQFAPDKDWGNRVSAAFIGIALMVAVGVTLYSYGSDLYSSLASTSWKRISRPVQRDGEAIEWINTHTNPEDVLVCYCDPLYFLHTGHKATRSMPMRAGLTWEAHRMLIFDIINESNSRYLISTSNDFDNEYQPEQQRESFKSLIDQHPEKFVLVFESTDRRSTIYRINSAE